MNQNPNNPPPQPPDIQAKFNQNDPALQQKVADFIQQAGGGVEPKEKTVIPPNNDFDIPNPNDTMLTEALISTEKLEITDMERQLFVKALLNEEPVRFAVTLFDGRFKVDLRSRTLLEQQRIFDVLNTDQNDGTIPPMQVDGRPVPDLASQVTRMNKYCMAFMIERINGDLFSELKLDTTDDLATSRDKMHAVVDSKLKAPQGIRWTAMMNAMRIFESKCAKMSTEANNPDFWKPRG